MKYNPLFWRCACLSVDAGSSETSLVEDYGDEETEKEDDPEKKNATADYGKISKAIARAQQDGTKVAPPAINRAQLDFYPDIEHNTILYALPSVTSVNPELASRIIAARPFTSLTDFVERIAPTKVQMINMIKAGCFDEFYPPETVRSYIMREYVTMISLQAVSRKEKLTMANFEKIVAYDLLPSEFELSRRVWRYKKFMEEHCYDKEKKRYLLEASNTLKFFHNYYMEGLVFGRDYNTIPNGYAVKKTAFDRMTRTLLERLKQWLGSPEACDLFYRAEVKQQFDSIWNKYCTGSVSKWEMQALHYYYHEHELAHVKRGFYHIVDFDSLPETPEVTNTAVGRDGREYLVYGNLVCICGTVINSDNNKHIVTILTDYGKVVDIKFPAPKYIHYNKVISEIDDKGVKHKIEGSWFDRGNLILVSGIRRELSFLPKTDWKQGFKHSIQLITHVNEDGTLVLREERLQK